MLPSLRGCDAVYAADVLHDLLQVRQVLHLHHEGAVHTALHALDLRLTDVGARGRDGGRDVGEEPAPVVALDDELITVGRHPESDIFLDDVTVSRNHALVVRRRDGLYIDDLGSLNGTYVNRRRIESHRLADGDEIQVGKYKLSYLER